MKERILNGLELVFIFICVMMAFASLENTSIEPSKQMDQPKTHNLA
ncbi:MAG: hypothetical protein KJO50_05320 [Bacteroidia bacterium]|nr:hypothetical protein [Bacteroidia bacterium]